MNRIAPPQEFSAYCGADNADIRGLVACGAVLRYAALTALIVATFPIWWSNEPFPFVPFLTCLTQTPLSIDRGLLAFFFACSLGSIVFAVANARRKLVQPVGALKDNEGAIGDRCRDWLARACEFAAAISLIGLFLLNQHRFQPWAYQGAILAGLFALASRERALYSWKLLTISIYCYSGLSKVDASFLAGLGKQMSTALWSLIGVSPISEPFASYTAWALPIGEFLLAIGLAFQQTSRLAWPLSIAFHGMLLLLLGPLGLNHKPGVLIWNIFFIGQNLLLWRCETVTAATGARMLAASSTESPIGPLLTKRNSPMGWGDRTAYLLLTIVLTVPVLEPFEVCDAWPAWGLYASHVAKTSLYFHESVEESLPKDWTPFLGPPDQAGWRQFQMDAWSLRRTNAPIYPNKRFSLAIATDLVQTYGSADGWLVLAISRANRWNQSRTVLQYDAFQPLEALQKGNFACAQVRRPKPSIP